MDAALLEELELQHRQVEDLLTQLADAEEADEQRPLVETLAEMLTRHMQIEETEVYPELATIDQEQEDEAEVEHGLGREGLAKLDEMIGQPGFGAVVAMVEAAIKHHVDEEEGEVFPQLREALGLAPDDASKKDLYERARRAGIEGRSAMTKEQLAAALQDAE